MKKNNFFQPTVWSLVVANLLVLGVSAYYKLTLLDILLIFWGETVVIAFFNFVKMVVIGSAPVIKSESGSSHNSQEEFISGAINFAVVFGKMMLIFWSTVLIAIFCMFQLALVVGVFGDESIKAAEKIPIQNLNSFLLGIALVILHHALSFFLNFLRKKEYQHLKLRRMVLAPFRRVLLVWLVIIAGAVLLHYVMQDSVWLLVPYFLLKIVFDLRQHMKAQPAVS